MKVLFIGDVVGRVGRRMLKEKIPHYAEKYAIDFIIANGENVSYGKGLTKNHYFELLEAGVDAITLGNHYLSKKEITRYIDQADRLVRPLNLIKAFPGEGSVVFEIDGISIRVTNVLGSAFMKEEVNAPYYSLITLLDEGQPTNVHIVDIHAEATGEKQSLAHALDGKVSAVLGTHTHVQTNDAKILPKGTAFISDVGMTGFVDGILGSDAETVVNRIVYGKKSTFVTPEKGRGVFSAVVIDIDDATGRAKQIFPIYFQENN
ncbi:MAG: TIGR00282 family metallophosphoesterase [Erysipelotrichia bacterium]|nr:TIGR00282 family metallophosphoesterase [Erysipelotrichia bacterium]